MLTKLDLGDSQENNTAILVHPVYLAYLNFSVIEKLFIVSNGMLFSYQIQRHIYATNRLVLHKMCCIIPLGDIKLYVENIV